MEDFLAGSGAERTLLLDLYRAALAAVRGDTCTAHALRRNPLGGTVHAVAVGKAAAAMLAGAHTVLQQRLRYALLITKPGHAAGPWPAHWNVIEAGHPLPDEYSLHAGHRLLDGLDRASADVQWLFLISGGASSLIEVLPEAVTLGDLQRLNAWLLASGWSIERMNAVRRRVSCIKSGRLLSHLAGRNVRALFISDVPNDDPALIGSGLLAAAGNEHRVDIDSLPNELRALLQAGPSITLPSSPTRVDCAVVASLEQALAAAAEAAAQRGYAVHTAQGRLEGDAVAVGRALGDTLRAGAPGVYVWGGETTVRLPEAPGQGGRCQQLALAAAERLTGCRGIALLAAGSDGSDGPGDSAGACVDGGTLQRGMAEGLEVQRALAQADAGRFLAAAGDLIDTGPTGTNVTDIVIGVKR